MTPSTTDSSSWFGSLPNSTSRYSRRRAEPPPGDVEESDFARLWKAFMGARVVIALALLGLHLALYVLGNATPAWLANDFNASRRHALIVAQGYQARPEAHGRCSVDVHQADGSAVLASQ